VTFEVLSAVTGMDTVFTGKALGVRVKMIKEF
jgi:hypothetical protein